MLQVWPYDVEQPVTCGCESENGSVQAIIGLYGSLSHKSAKVIAIGCKGLLKDFAITNVKVAFWKSLFTWSSSPQLYNYVPSNHTTTNLNVYSPLTPTLSLQIAAQATPQHEGTGGLFICEVGKSKRVFLLMAQHVIIPPNAKHNQLYAHMKSSKPPPWQRSI
jgi:hypothetical protein